MTDDEEIIRIAAKGDGVTTSGRHFSGTVPGDLVSADGAIEPGPHRVTPPCSHFTVCGGCQLQYADEVTLRRFVTDRVLLAAEGQGLVVGEVLPTHLSPARARRRATLHALKTTKGTLLGFKESKSHRIVNLQQCEILMPELFALVRPLKQLIGQSTGKASVDTELTWTDQGVDCQLKGLETNDLAATEAVLDFAREHRLARLALDQGYGAEPVWEPEPVTVTLSGTAVPFPQGSFLQPTLDGESILVEDSKRYLQGAATIADLFSGLGTFAFALADSAKVLAAEAARDAHLACKSAASARGYSVHALHRDLFRNPLQADEASRFGAILLDPPRAGAREQVAQIAASTANRVVYISCNPSSWARDAKTLVDAGFQLKSLRPVGQFRWSTHVELSSYFTR